MKNNCWNNWQKRNYTWLPYTETPTLFRNWRCCHSKYSWPPLRINVKLLQTQSGLETLELLHDTYLENVIRRPKQSMYYTKIARVYGTKPI